MLTPDQAADYQFQRRLFRSRNGITLREGLLLLVAVGAYVFVSSDAGRILVAIRENEERCRYLGLNTSRVKIRLMAACSAIAALAGGFYVLFGSVAAHSYGDFVFGTELVVWTALGGRGTLIGPVVGTVGVNYVSALLGRQPAIRLVAVRGVRIRADRRLLASGACPCDRAGRALC